ncbi:MAG: aminomethyl-transferring glycine dehydrogenase [Cryomorphaceae bacterium]
MPLRNFPKRHIGPREHKAEEMLNQIGVSSIDELIDRTVPGKIRLKKPLDLHSSRSEHWYLRNLEEISKKNTVNRSYIGMGYYNTIVPPAIQRNVLENPGWYTAYTPYQSEIAQGRLEALINFQTMVMDFTQMEIANASLLDEATAAAEAMTMFYALRSRKDAKDGVNQFFVSEQCFPQTIDVLRTRALPMGIDLIVGDHKHFNLGGKVFGALVQYPNADGNVVDYRDFVEAAHENDVMVAVAADLMSLTLLTPPGEWGADAVVGNTQRFGVPMGFGGPHAAYFATREKFKRHVPGRIVGVSTDRHGNPAYRLALQTREQHIRRDKATSNICTAQALLAIMASMYAVYHGPEGIKTIAKEIHRKTIKLAGILTKLGYTIENDVYFDTLEIGLPEGVSKVGIEELAEEKGINLKYYTHNNVGISLDETISRSDFADLNEIFARAASQDYVAMEEEVPSPIKGFFERTSNYLTHPVFNRYHSETEMMRYLKRLENKDLSLTHSMIALGSCTMKLNSASELMPITWPEWANIHPFAPHSQTAGYREMFEELKNMLCEITGFAGISLQPNSGAQGEYAGLMVIRNYHISRGDGHRNVALIPSSAHGTNPASAVMAGMEVVVVKCDDQGNIDLDDLKAKAEKHSESLSALMVTYPSTHGVFEESILEITEIIHANDGQVYMDGANMNAQVGLTNPGIIGADVCHLNLHKTFAIPHGGGGPGMGPIGVAEHLVPFLPGHSVVETGGINNISAVSAAPWGSALILLISYGYIKMLGRDGITDATKNAILNANYIKSRLERDYKILYTGKNDTVAHEMVVDCRPFKNAGIEVADIAKRLIDYGFHAPTVSWPVAGTLMIEPTESESKEELDRFCDAMLEIRKEVIEIEQEIYPKDDNVLVNAPHTAAEATADEWNHAYSRQKAVYPLSYTIEGKFWAPVGRVDNAKGDRNLVCSCPPIEQYEPNLSESEQEGVV